MPAYPGRPREFKYEKRCELLEHVSKGSTVEEAAQIVGVSLRTVEREAKHNEHFDHDLQLALHAAPVDPHQLVLRAARTHWRAAAWLLERTDPDRFAKRPPNSCSYGTLQDMSDWLIETALEATPPEHREAVYRRLRGVADKALEVLMPDQHDARRALVGSLPERPMPLSDHEIAKTLGVVDDCRADVAGLPSAPVGSLAPALAGSLHATLPAGELDAEPPGASPAGAHANGHHHDATHRRSATGAAANGVTRTGSTAPDGTSTADPVSWYRRHPYEKSWPYERPSDSIENFRLQDSDRMDAEWRYPPFEDDDDDADDAGSPPFAPPNGGIMSPKMSAATKPDAAGLEPTDSGRLPATTFSPTDTRTSIRQSHPRTASADLLEASRPHAGNGTRQPPKT
jgi:hypothetical protein